MNDDTKHGRKHPLRDYGLGDSTAYVKGVPRVVEDLRPEAPCPNCGGQTLFVVQVDVEGHPIIKSGIGSYVGCAACPYASKMLIIGEHVK